MYLKSLERECTVNYIVILSQTIFLLIKQILISIVLKKIIFKGLTMCIIMKKKKNLYKQKVLNIKVNLHLNEPISNYKNFMLTFSTTNLLSSSDISFTESSFSLLLLGPLGDLASM